MRAINQALVADRKGVWWDIALYLPTVSVLALIGAKLWYTPGSQSWTYVLVFLASFFGIAGVNRVLGRMLILPKAPVALDIDKQRVRITLRGGGVVELVKDLRYFPDYAGRSFGLVGMDLTGRRQQFVFHKGQFPDLTAYRHVNDALRHYA
ncbi:MAG: hypothetical protein OEW08_01375 [Gammaproteobacteria bacterium]|nr:hypothetical protein [Gammaproteobacteria bacterium]